MEAARLGEPAAEEASDPMSARLEQILRELLSERREEAVRRERSAFDEQAGASNARLVLFGAGNLGRKTLSGLRAAGIEPIAFTDNDPALWGKEVAGVAVVSPEEASRRHGESAVFVVTIWRGEGTDRMRERCGQLRRLGCARVVTFLPLFWRYPEVFLPHYAVDLPHGVLDEKERIQRAFELLSDDASRIEFIGEVRWRLLGDFDELGEPVENEIYFPEDLRPLSRDEVFVDCGAFDGDTIRRVLARRPDFQGRIKALEPDPANFARLDRYVKSLPPALQQRMEIYPWAASSRREVLRFNATGTEAASLGSGSAQVQAVPLDELLADCRPTYIKMDTEGAELEAIRGAARTIAAHRPAMAICVYHRQNHLWEIPLLVDSCGGGYRFHLRPQLLEGWDLVCYAIPR
jgi:FkbM family methyltransferase